MNLKQIAVAVAALGTAASAGAASFTFNGNIANSNDVISIAFTLTSNATNVAVWTDSYNGGVNFDPITAVWVQSGSDYKLVGENDDDDSIAPGQTIYDSGLTFASLDAGNYLFTITPYNNFAVGNLLSQGFAYSGQPGTPLSQWCQPASHCGMGTYYEVHLSGVDDASNITPVPEPETYAMLMAGLGVVGALRRRRKQA